MAREKIVGRLTRFFTSVTEVHLGLIPGQSLDIKNAIEIENGDHLKIYDDGETIFDKEIDLIIGYDLEGDKTLRQNGWSVKDWYKFFNERLTAELIKKE